MELPEIPEFKRYADQLTLEQKILNKLFQRQSIDNTEEVVLKEAIGFYKNAFASLRGIDLSKTTLQEAESLKKYLDSIFNITIHFQNKIRFSNVFRSTIVKDNFLDGGKIRDIKYLKHPDIEIVKKSGLYNRANSNSSTRFYCSFYPAVAVTEIQPQVNDRIIIAQWHNYTNTRFATYPIAYADVENENVRAATNAFSDRMKFNNPFVAEIFKLRMQFLGHEFVKNVNACNPYRFEYLISAFFADRILTEPLIIGGDNPEEFEQYDALIYPSVAYQHLHENMAVVPNSVEKLKLISAKEILVQRCFWQNVDPKDIDNDLLPIAGIVLRELKKIEGTTLIWNDD